MRPVCKHLAGSRSHGGSLVMSVVRHTSVVSARSARHIVQACPAQWQALAHEAGPGPLSAATCRSLPSPQHTRAVAGCSLWGSASFCTGRRCIAAGTATRTPETNGNGTSAADCLADQLKIESRLFEPPDTPNPPTFVKTDGRVIAIGDIHGDLEKTMDALQLAGVLTLDQGRPVWTGGDTVVVQVGDILDRGDQEIVTVMLLRDLHRQAKREGGAVYMLNGNHESLNVCGDFRYVTEGAFIESGQVAGLSGQVSWQTLVRARVGLYAPGGAMAIELSKNPTVLVVNDTVFAHGGLLPMHVSYGLEKINQEVASWMRAEILEDGSYAPPPFIAMGDSNSIVWNRTFGRESFKSFYDQFRAGKTLTEMLEPLGVKRLVIGHTPQVAGANAELEERVWRIDVGMSSGVLGAPAAVLEIVKNESGDTEVQVLSIDGPPSEPSPQELLAAQGL